MANLELILLLPECNEAHLLASLLQDAAIFHKLLLASDRPLHRGAYRPPCYAELWALDTDKEAILQLYQDLQQAKIR